MNTSALGVFLLLVLPVAAFFWLFRKNWVDQDIRSSVSKGFFVGILCVYLTKLIYLPIEWFLGSDLRSFMSSSIDWHVAMFASIGIIGLVEESVKAAGALLVVHFMGFGRRSTLIFMAFAGVAMSFSFFENMQYFVVFGESVVLPRSFISSSAHLFFSCLCAAFIAIAMNRPKSDSIISFRILAAISLAAILHGLFDFLVFQFHIDALTGLLIALVALFIVGIYESWIAVLRIDRQPGEGLMICSGCGAFSIGRARFCNFCGARVILSRRDFTIKMEK